MILFVIAVLVGYMHVAETPECRVSSEATIQAKCKAPDAERK